MDAGPLHPVGGHRPSHLDEGRTDGPGILGQRVVDHNLLNLHIVGHEPVAVDASLDVAGACVVATPPGNDDNIKNCALEIDILRYWVAYLCACSSHGPQKAPIFCF